VATTFLQHKREQELKLIIQIEIQVHTFPICTVCDFMYFTDLCSNKHHAIKAYWESRFIAPSIFYLDTTHPPIPLDRRVGGPQSRSGHGVEEKNSQASPGIEPRSTSLTYLFVNCKLHIAFRASNV